MKLTFLGTRGEIEAQTRQHRMHTALLVSYRGKKVMIDCGLDWLGKFECLHPDAIVLTHAATLTRSFVRTRGDRLIGHATVRTQLDWCAKEGVPRAVITHCGSEIVKGDVRKLASELRAMASERGIEAQIAHDRMELVLR